MPSVTPGRPEDAEAIVETLRSQLRAELMAATIYAGTGIVSFVRSQLERADPVMGWFVVHRSSDSLQGFAEFRLRGEVLFLNNIYVREEATGRGIGQALLAAGLTRFGGPGALALELDVFEDNSRAKRWYQGLGLTRCARRVWWLSRGSLLPGGEDCRIILPDGRPPILVAGIAAAGPEWAPAARSVTPGTWRRTGRPARRSDPPHR